jgi:hypothetical protein
MIHLTGSKIVQKLQKEGRCHLCKGKLEDKSKTLIVDGWVHTECYNIQISQGHIRRIGYNGEVDSL